MAVVSLPHLARFYGDYRHILTKVAYCALFYAAFRPTPSSGSSKKPKPDFELGRPEDQEEKKNQLERETQEKKKISKDFLKDLLKLIKIVMPWKSKQSILLIVHTLFLIARTMISVWVAALDGKLVSSLVSGKGKLFLKYLILWMAISIPAVFTNASINYLQTQLSLCFRNSLTKYINDKYIPKSIGNSKDKTLKKIPTYYGLLNLDDRINNPDQLITVDIDNFTKNLVGLYSNLSKPMLDIIIYCNKLSSNIGSESMIIMGLLIQLTSNSIKFLQPPFGKYVSQQTSLEGEFRQEHSKIIEYSEEIALFKGEEFEKSIVDEGYFTLIKYINFIIKKRFYFNIFEDFIIKYTWGALGLMLCSIPVFFQDSILYNKSIGTAILKNSDISGNFITNRRLLVSTSDAFGRIMKSYKKISQLSGYTSRVTNLIKILDDIKVGKYQKSKLNNKLTVSNPNEVIKYDSNLIKFENIPIVSPNGDILIPNLSFELKYGENLLIIGPNGCGKSSLFRLLGKLWPIYNLNNDNNNKSQLLIRPNDNEIFYIPQRPYLSFGSLRQQILYPDDELLFSIDEKVKIDLKINSILEILEIKSIFKNLNQIENWKDTNIGLQQTIGIARLWYHKPKFAILDECTSSINIELEEKFYNYCKEMGISILTVSHRDNLYKYHDFLLQITNEKKVKFKTIDSYLDELKLIDEKNKLKKLIDDIPAWERRLSALKLVLKDEKRKSQLSLHQMNLNANKVNEPNSRTNTNSNSNLLSPGLTLTAKPTITKTPTKINKQSSPNTNKSLKPALPIALSAPIQSHTKSASVSTSPSVSSSKRDSLSKSSPHDKLVSKTVKPVKSNNQTKDTKSANMAAKLAGKVLESPGRTPKPSSNL